jgi:hypothetical protein
VVRVRLIGASQERREVGGGGGGELPWLHADGKCPDTRSAMFSAFFIDQWSHDSNWMIESWENEGGMADGKLDPGFGGREGSGGLWCACSSCLLFFEANCGYRRISDALRRWKLTSDGQVQVQVQVQTQTQTQEMELGL